MSISQNQINTVQSKSKKLLFTNILRCFFNLLEKNHNKPDKFKKNSKHFFVLYVAFAIFAIGMDKMIMRL